MYEKHENISQSELKLFEKEGPEYFYEKKYIKKDIYDDEPSAEAQYFTDGKVIHTLLLEKELFDSRYKVVDFDIPEGKLSEFVYLKKAYILSGLTEEESNIKAKEKCELKYTIDRILSETSKSQYKDYSDALDAYGMDISLVSKTTYGNALNILNKINDNKLAVELLRNSDDSNNYYEYEIFADINISNILFGAKGKLDKLKVFKNTNKAIIIDIKTTYSIPQFKYLYRKFKYYRQLQYYKMLLEADLFNKEFKSYDIEAYIIALENTPRGLNKVFKISQEDLNKGLAEIEEIVPRLNWHIVNNIWVDKDNYEGNPTILNINE